MLHDLIATAQRLKNELDTLRPLSPEVEARVMQKLRIDWNYHSNNMEGNSLTYGETRALLLYGMTAKGKPLSDHLEISGHQSAIDWLLEMVQKKEGLTGYFVRRLHEIIFGEQINTKIRVGAYKETPNYLVTKSGETINFATPEETPAKMQDLLEQFNKNEANSEVNPILLAAAFHHQFVLIHPFEDGNGRMSRLLMNFILMRAGYPPAVIRTNEKEAYYTALQLSDAENSALPLAEYLAGAVIHSLELMLKGARGESIEEPDDLDKQLAMLDKQLNTPKIQHLRSEKTMELFCENNLPLLAKSIKKAANKFKNFYVKISFLLKYPYVWDIDVHVPDSYAVDEFNELYPTLIHTEDAITEDDFIETYIKNVKKSSKDVIKRDYKPQNHIAEYNKWEYEVVCLFDTFNRQNYQHFNYELNVKLIFNKTNYSIQSSGLELIKYYDDLLMHDTLDSFFLKAGQAHFDYIQSQINEQQKTL